MNRLNPGPNERFHQVTETVAVSPRSIWRRALHGTSGASVLVHSLRSQVAEPRRVLELELQKWRRLGTLALESAPCAVGGELSLIAEDFEGAPLLIPPDGLELGMCLELALGMTRLLHRVHEQGMLYEDVCPESFLVNRASGRVEFADLLAATDDSGAALFEFAPSPAYIAPERTGRLNRRPDHRADYYSLGVTLFQMLTGQLPFMAADDIGWAHAHSSKRAPLVTERAPGLPEVLARLVAKLLAKDPNDRYQSGYGLLSDLQALSESFRRTRELPPLVLGTRDVSGRLTVSGDVVGREAELSALSSVLDDLRSSQRRLVLLPGGVGAGKSAVLAEFLRRQAGTPARLLSTAFEERSQAVPLSGLALSLRGLAAELLSLSESELNDLHRRVTQSLGHNAQILADLVPALSCVTGSSASVVPLNPIEAQRRLQHVFVSFVRVFATAERPLVFVLDDCQWLDAASAEILTAILTSPDSSHVMVVASFRAEGLEHVPALLKMQQALEQANEDAVSLPLTALSLDAVNEIVARSLREPPSEVRQLAEVLRRKTYGNPFFIGQLLVSLHREGALRLDHERGRWVADLERAEARQASDNVGALMAERLDNLSPEAARLLSSAACFGLRFDLKTLAVAVDVPRAVCADLLREASVHDLVAPTPADERAEVASQPQSGNDVPTGYAFEHSRIQQAALSRLNDGQRLHLHARIGRILRQRMPDGAPSLVFDVLHHLNAARSALLDPEERRDLLELNLTAEHQALQSGAWSIAGAHAEIAVELAEGLAEQRSPELTFRALFARAETALVLADGRVEAFCDEALRFAPDRLARGRVHVLKVRVLEHGARMAEAVVQVRAALTELGVHLPATLEEINQGIGEGLGKLQAHLARVTIEGLPALPTAEDAESRLILELLAQVIPPAFQTCPPLFILAELVMFDRALSRGVDAVSCKNFADCGIILLAVLGDYESAYRMGLAAFELLKRFAPTPVESGVCFVFVGFLAHWKASYRELFAVYDRAEKSGLMLGDLQHAGYAKNDRAQRSFLVGVRLPACRELVADMRRYFTHISASGQLVNALVVERVVARLTASEAEQEAVAAAEREATAVIAAEKSTQYCYAYGQAQMMTSFILGDFAAAERWMEFTREFLVIAAGQFSLPDYKLFEGLLAARAFRAAPSGEQTALLTSITENLKQLEAWSRSCPENFAHKYHFLAAEHARLTAQPLELVLGRYRDAVRTAGDGFIHLRALVHEHEARLWLAQDLAQHARTCLETAYRLYDDWGATAKLRLLVHEYPALLADASRFEMGAPRGPGAKGQGFDTASLLKATESIFVEVEPERLFAALMATLIENAGAQHGCLVLRDEGDRAYYVEARAHVERPGSSRSERVVYTEADFLCPSVVSYVLRSGEAVTLDDAAKAGAFQRDPQVQKRGVRSVLCAPIMRQGDLIGVLYVENNLSAYAFPRERLAALQVLASQAAISIYNAQLYESLERRVAQRTEELALKNRQIASMLDNLEQGVFTIDRTFRVEPGYSRQLPEIFGTTDLVGRNCLELLLDGSSVRPDVRSVSESALFASFDQEPWLAAVSAEHLVREVERTGPGGDPQSLEISWNYITSEQGLVERLLVTVRDVTLLHRLRQTARKKEREVDIIVQVLDCGVEVMQAFAVRARQLLAENRAALASDVPLTAELVSAAFRNLHTLKGNSRLYGFTHLVDCVHAAEDAYDTARQRPTVPIDRLGLRACLDAVEAVLGEYESVVREKLAVIKKSDERSESVLQDIRSLLVASPSSDSSRELLPELRRILARLDQTSVARLVEETRTMLPGLAAELGKPVPIVLTEHAEVQLHADWATLVKDILVQCLRNCVYHGIEPADVRELAGKPAHGCIQVRSRDDASAFELQIFDDGRGLPLEKLRERSGNAGHSDEVVAEQIFVSGVSTAGAIDHIAGRGVGLDVVRASLRRRGGDAQVRFTAEERVGHRPFMLVILMPKSALASRPSVILPAFP